MDRRFIRSPSRSVFSLLLWLIIPCYKLICHSPDHAARYHNLCRWVVPSSSTQRSAGCPGLLFDREDGSCTRLRIVRQAILVRSKQETHSSSELEPRSLASNVITASLQLMQTFCTAELYLTFSIHSLSYCSCFFKPFPPPPLPMPRLVWPAFLMSRRGL